MLLSSQMPFYGRKRRHIVEQIMHGRYEFKGRRWKRISAQAKEFVQDLLCVDPEERAAAEEALSASWLNRRFTATVRNPYQEELASANQSILAYSKYSKIKQIALLICAHKATTTEIGILRKVFQKYDTEKNGQLSYDEFKAALRDAGYSEKEYRTIFDAVVRCFFFLSDCFFLPLFDGSQGRSDNSHRCFVLVPRPLSCLLSCNCVGVSLSLLLSMSGFGRNGKDSVYRVLGSDNRSTGGDQRRTTS